MNITHLIRIHFFVFKIKNHLDKGFMTLVQLVFFCPWSIILSDCNLNWSGQAFCLYF